MEKYSAGQKNSRRVGNPVKKGRGGSSPVPVRGRGKGAGKRPDLDVNVLNEEEAVYARDVFAINSAGTPVTALSSFQKMKMSERGVAKRELEKLKERTSLNYDQLAGLLLVTKATLINKSKSSRFNSSISEKIISIWEIYIYGDEVFANESLFREWLFRSNQALGGKMPFEFLHSSFGREEIRNLLGRIEYGRLFLKVMEVFRVSATKYADDKEGEGARLFGGRWNLKGTPCIYTSESRALALLEYSVNVSLDIIPRALSMVCFEIPERNLRKLSVAELPGNWRNAAIPMSTKDFGTSILLDGKTFAIKVPSVIIPDEFNYVINPLQYDPDGFRIKNIKDFPYDIRIKRYRVE